MGEASARGRSRSCNILKAVRVVLVEGSSWRAGQNLTEVSQESLSFISKDKTLYDVVSRFAGIKQGEEVYPCFLALIELFENKENRDL